jgi:V/A-type H+/Na+-transporting ATPase subunit E
MSQAASNTLEKVATEFAAEVTTTLQQGRDEALAKIESARKETAEEVAKILETSVKQSESVKRQIVGAAELDTRNDQLKALEKAVTEVFDSAVAHISKSSGSDYEKPLERLVEEGVNAIGPRAKVQCSSRDRKVVSSVIRKLDREGSKLTLESEPIETIGGVVLTSTDGTVRFDNTFEARLERMRPTLRKEVAAMLTESA